MRIIRKSTLFCVNAILTGALIVGAPVCIRAEETGTLQPKNSQNVWSDPDSSQLEEEVDHSMEGQLKPPSVSSGENSFISSVDDSTDNTYGYYTIMGDTTVTTEEMSSLYNGQNLEYPSEIMEQGGAPDIDTFCQMIVEEANAEGIRGEVVFVQAMLETGWLQYGGDSQISQFNFSGLGTTGGGVKGNSFPDVRTGLRAQVQHLKAYASSEELNQSCVDSRFSMVTRETAPYVEWLGIQENPYGGGWAAGAGYGTKLRKLLADLKGTEYTPQVTDQPGQ